MVTAHLASFVDVGLPSFFVNMAKHRFDYDKAADTLARRLADRPMTDLIATLRTKAAKKSAIPLFPEEMTVTDVVIHTQDVRRALGLDGQPTPEQIAIGLSFLTTDKKAAAVVGKGVYEDLRFESTDSDWSFGDGDLLRGPSEALLLAMAGRDVYGELTGEGVAILQARFT